MKQRDRFLIIDGHSMIYQALYKRGPPLRSPSGEPTRGTFFFCQMLFALVDLMQPEYLAMAVDAPRKSTWRRKLFPAYKANRDDQEPPEEMIIQMRRIKQIVAELGIAVAGVDGFEADDVIASLVATCASPEVECIICSRDTDLHQLVSPDCKTYDAVEEVWTDEAAVEKRWGVPPSQIVELMTLSGDDSDNVPGVKGIGEKGALKLIQRFGSVQGVMDARRALTETQRKNLEAADLDLCRNLVQLRKDLSVPVGVKDLEFDGFDMAGARSTFRKLGFKAWS